MKRFLAALALGVAAAFAVAPGHAQQVVYATGARDTGYSPQQLDQMLAPIALYPDPLLSQLLMAAAYPSDVAEAARWSRANPALQGEDAVRAVDGMDWDASVKSLVAFPQILEQMDADPGWTEALGQAFLGQQDQVMDTIQGLRQRAYTAGNLRTGAESRVVIENGFILIVPAAPDVVYVPYYDPAVAYGSWWWPAYPPVRWPASRRYYPTHAPRGPAWGSGVSVSAGFFFGHFDWRQRDVEVHPGAFYYRGRDAYAQPGPWRYDESRRRGAGYRNGGYDHDQPLPAAPAYLAPASRNRVPVSPPVQNGVEVLRTAPGERLRAMTPQPSPAPPQQPQPMTLQPPHGRQDNAPAASVAPEPARLAPVRAQPAAAAPAPAAQPQAEHGARDARNAAPGDNPDGGLRRGQ